MAQNIKGNYNALTWLQDELQQSLAAALSAINLFIDDSANTKSLSDCIEAIYQVKGTLEMLNLTGAMMLAEEVQLTVAALRDNKSENPQAAQEAIVKALLLMPNYLKMLSESFEDHPLSLIENINELRTYREQDIYDERSLFTPTLNTPLPERIAPDPLRKLPRLGIDILKLSHVYQIHLLNWLKSGDNESLQKILNITHYMRMSSHEEKITLLWWAAETLLDALIHDGLAELSPPKQLLGKLVSPLKMQCSNGEKTLLQSYPNELLTNLLFAVAKATTQSANVALLKQTFGLNFFDQKQKIYGMSDNALSNAHHALLEQLQEIKSEVDEYDHSHEDNASLLSQITNQLQSMSDTLALLEEYEASNLLHHQFEQLQVLISNEQQPDELSLTELADTLLKVEGLIQASDTLAINDDLRNTVISECLLEMANIKEALTLINQSQVQASQEFTDIANQLTLISGSLNILNYPEAALLTTDTAEKIRSYITSERSFNQTQLNQLADILACCDIFMQGIRQHSQTQNYLLQDASEKLLEFDGLEDIDESEKFEESPPVETTQFEATGLEFNEVNDSLDERPALNEELVQTADQESQFAEGIDEEIASIFIEEADEVLAELKQLIPQWLQQENSAALSDIRRHFHTLKGSGRMAGASVIGELAWSVEEVLNHVLQGTRPESKQVHQLVSEVFDYMPALLERFTHGDLSSDEKVSEFTDLSKSCLSASESVEQSEPEESYSELDVLEFENPELEILEFASQDSDAPDILSFDTDEEAANGELSIADEFDESRIELDIPSLDDHEIDSSELILMHDDSDETQRHEKQQEKVQTSVERYIQTHCQSLSSVDTAGLSQQQETISNPVLSFSSVDRYIVQQNCEQTRVDVYIQTLEAASHHSASSVSNADVKPFTSVDRYILQQNRPLTNVDRYIQKQQNQEAQQADVETTVVTRPFTSVDHYILQKERPVTKVDLYIQARTDEPTDLSEFTSTAVDDTELSEEQELQQIFKNEAQQHIHALQAEWSTIEQSHKVTKQALRSIHSLKGCANIAGVTPMAIIATEMNQTFSQLHAHHIALDDNQLQAISGLIEGLNNILLSLDGLTEEPDIAELGALLNQLTCETDEDSAIKQVMDPEFLVVFLQETDELLEKYTEQLTLWYQAPENEANNKSLAHTLSLLHESAIQADQTAIASVYSALASLIEGSTPSAAGLKSLLEHGYEELNTLIEILLQNKPITAPSTFPIEVKDFLEQQSAEPVEPAQSTSIKDIDETDFAIPSDVDPELLEAFSEESAELLVSSGKAIKNWQAGLETKQSAQQLQRDLHTIKGGARLAGITPMADLTHQMETLVNRVIEEQQSADEVFFDLLLRCQDKLTEMQEQLAVNHPVTTAVSLIAEIAMLTGQQAAEPVTSTATNMTPENIRDLDESEFAIPNDTDEELLEAFTEEASELLLSSGNAIKQWLNSIQTEEAAQQLLRDLHTVKGGARLSGILPIADLAHKVETLVKHVHEHPETEDEVFFDLLQRCQDKLTEMQEQLAAKQAVTTAVSLMAEVDYLTGNQSPIVTAVETAPAKSTQPSDQPVSQQTSHTEQVRVRADILDNLTNYAGEISISRDRVTQQHMAMQQQLFEMEETVARLRDQLRKLEIETETQILFRYDDELLHQNQEFDPLELDRFSMIQQLSRGLTESVIDLLDISQSMDNLTKETDTLLLQQSRLNSDLQHGLMHTRLLPFATISPRMERIVRQTSGELGKKAELSISGADLELDRTILDRLVAPIEHILRNAIAHGIESAEQRQASGKEASGHLHIQIKREGSEMLLTIQDDGQGINIEKVRQKALSQGLINEYNQPSDEDLVQLILTSGFSTADSISQVAGRGVGMDVVSNEIRSLKGRLSIQSKQGKGTTFSIRLPLTLSVLQALLVSVQDEQYAMPLGTVTAGERIKVAEIKELLAQPHPKYYANGESFEFIPLATMLDKTLKLPELDKAQLPILLFRSGDIRFAILVDAVMGNREIVIKPVGKQLAHINVLNGATILGDGRVVFILDIPTLIDIGLEKITSNESDAITLERDLKRIQDRPLTAMVVDDSITMRKATGNLLRRLGFEVMTAKDGVDALSQLHTQTPDIILLDVEMPRMDGFEFASMVRNDIKFRHLPIIMITSRTGDKHRERAMSIGVNAYLGKPFQEDILVENMKRLLGNRFFEGHS